MKIIVIKIVLRVNMKNQRSLIMLLLPPLLLFMWRAPPPYRFRLLPNTICFLAPPPALLC